MSVIKNKKKAIYGQVLLSVVGFLVLVAISVPLSKNVSQQYEINTEIKGLNTEIKNLEEKNSNFIKLIDYLESDQFVEEQARLKLNYQKEGEELIIIKNKDSVSNNSIQRNLFGKEEGINIKEKSNPGKWLYYFFKI